MFKRDARISAVLGPTNTGKTHYAIQQMLSHRTGVIGLPLRLLAREVYDRIVALRGPSVVALVTGERPRRETSDGVQRLDAAHDRAAAPHFTRLATIAAGEHQLAIPADGADARGQVETGLVSKDAMADLILDRALQLAAG